MTNPDRPLKAGPDPDYRVTQADLQAIHQREVERVAARKRYVELHLAAAPRLGAALRALEND